MALSMKKKMFWNYNAKGHTWDIYKSWHWYKG